MLRVARIRWILAVTALLAALPPVSVAQDDPNDVPLGDVARSLRHRNQPTEGVIDDDNFSTVLQRAESSHAPGSSLRFLMTGASRIFQVSTPDATCSLSFSANAKSLLSGQYSQMELPPGEVAKLVGPATIESDSLSISIFNRTEWHVSEVAVAVTVVNKKPAPVPSDGTAMLVLDGYADGSDSEGGSRKKPDVTVIYRIRAAAPPFATTVFSAPLNLDLAPGAEWHWAIVQARGYPPQSYVAREPQSSPRTTDPVAAPAARPVAEQAISTTGDPSPQDRP